MCRDCPHWRRLAGWRAPDGDFAPCALKPDRYVDDRRAPGGKTLQAYVTSATYLCKDFAGADTQR